MRFAFLLALLGCTLIAAAAGPTLVNIAFHDYEDGPPLLAGRDFSNGATVHLSFQIAGFKIHETEDENRIKLSYKIEAIDSANRPLADPKTGKIDTDLAPEDKKWTPKVRYSVQVPEGAESGQYIIRIAVNDEVADTTSTTDIASSSASPPGMSCPVRSPKMSRVSLPAQRPAGSTSARLNAWQPSTWSLKK